jgi:hypothetical protein
MATYLRGITDQVNVINPPQMNHQFEMQLLQQRQSKYDQAHARINQMYSTILNSPLSRSDNKEARDQFFKTIENDIKRIAQSDLSLENNARMAEGLFAQIYNNDHLVKDMVWTKNYNAQMQKAEMFKNCLSESDCGGLYWDEGVKYMEYKKQEFMNAGRDEALRMQDAEYVPYKNLTEAAIKYAKEAGLNVTMDELSDDGRYIVTYKNGEKVKNPLALMYDGLFKDNYQYQQMYKVRSYNQRNDWMRQAVSEGKYETLNEARVGFIKENYEVAYNQIQEEAKKASMQLDNTNAIINAYQEQINEGNVLTPEQQQNYQNYLGAKSALESLSVHLDKFEKANAILEGQENTQSKLENMMSFYDDMNAMAYLNSDIAKAVETMSARDMSVTIKANDYGKMKEKYQNDLSLQRERNAAMIKAAEIRAAGMQNRGANEFLTADVTKLNKITNDFTDSAGKYTEAGKLDKLIKLRPNLTGTWEDIKEQAKTNPTLMKDVAKVEAEIELEKANAREDIVNNSYTIIKKINKGSYANDESFSIDDLRSWGQSLKQLTQKQQDNIIKALESLEEAGKFDKFDLATIKKYL